MIVTAVPSTRSGRPARQVEPRLACLLADLEHLGLRGRVLADEISGETDVRLRVRADARPVCVELMWCHPDEAPPATAMAVRIVGGERRVWRDTGSRCRPAELARFLCDLLVLDEAALATRYLLLG